ncbi:calcineurin-like phosphoesterase C-terminal domain-containing protein [Sphingobacterium tabacisoli]|uniref:Calcineurin-like phosphoesterase C-terminal domain-containing protein n=1 Tax=Sphingobacterium tabacisoli TaxID=2044855 RepID=A0ABW5KX74_9SPHI|nr:calcineurin-like phosphoesterase family protein [Sphingobacterium tabacisoli]
MKAFFRFASLTLLSLWMSISILGCSQRVVNSVDKTVVSKPIPDQIGATVKGRVSSNGKGLYNVVVSDGVEVTTTNEDGVYYLASNKKYGYVFVSIPSNYEVSTVSNLPQFFKYLRTATKEVEIVDFELKPVDNDNHSVVVMTDFHLADRTDDLVQYAKFVKDVNNSIGELQSQGKKVYGLTLGDLSWDNYWYSRSFALPEYVLQMNKLNATVFNTIGNHDNDPYIEGDWDSGAAYRKYIGPTYYSFNIGQIHYVVLDNVDYINEGGRQGKIGKRNYKASILHEQMNWLKKDLEMVKDKATPIVLAMHVQLNNAPKADQSATIRLDNGKELMQVLAPFKRVQVLTGHTHVNYRVENTPNLMEHNIAAVCATWWWTGKNGYTGNHIAQDGSPGGYMVWNMNGRDMDWYYKGIDKPKEYQFRAYDLNVVKITAAQFAPNTTEAKMKEYTHGYETAGNKNEVLINVWGYDPKWKVDVTENGVALKVNRVEAYDPLHMVSYTAMRLNDNVIPSKGFVTSPSSHFFKTTATSANSTLNIKVTDRFGKVYEESMVRPKKFSVKMM